MAYVNTNQSTANSPDTLKITGYTVEKLVEYIKRELGFPTVDVILTDQQIRDCVQDALGLVSVYAPITVYVPIPLDPSQTRYKLDPTIIAVVNCDFLDPNALPNGIIVTGIFDSNANQRYPIFGSGLGEFNSYQNWIQTYRRVCSIQSDWLWDQNEMCLWIYNPISRYYGLAECCSAWTTTEKLTPFLSNWVKEYSIARAEFRIGNIMSRYSGVIPGPVASITLDQSKRGEAKEKMDKLVELLRTSQTPAPIYRD